MSVSVENPRAFRFPRRLTVRYSLVFLLMILLTAAMLVVRRSHSNSSPVIPHAPLDDMSPAVAELLTRQYEKVQTSPDSAVAWGVYGMCLLQHERPREALICFEQAEALQPSNGKWPYFSGIILLQTDLHAASRKFRLSGQIDPTSTSAALKLASVLLQLDQPVEAEQELDRILQYHPTLAEAYVQLMRIARQKLSNTDAEQIYQRASAGKAISRELLIELAAIRMLQNDSAGADAIMRQAAEARLLAPQTRDPWLEELGKFDASGVVASARADALRQQGQIQEASRQLSMLDRDFPDRSRAGLNRATLLMDTGNSETALQELLRLAERFPDDPLIQFHLGVAWFNLNQLDTAEKFMRTAIQQKPDFASALAALADICDRTDRISEAALTLQSAVAVAPEDLRIHLQLVDVLLRNHETEKARQQLTIAEELWSRLSGEGPPLLGEQLTQLKQSLMDSSKRSDPL